MGVMFGTAPKRQRARPSLRIETGARTDLGRVRKNNEDNFKIEEPLNLFVLSDGMGGQAHGEVASALAVDTVITHCQQAENNLATPSFGEPQADCSEKTNRLVSAIHLANRTVFDTASADPTQRGMGATIVAAWIDGQRLSLAHVGDSRAYLLRTGTLSQLTADHSLVAEKVRCGLMTPQEAEVSEMQNVLTRALGTAQEVEVDADEQVLLPGDTLLFCSDGLSHMATDPEIASTLLTTTSAQEAADRLVDLANENGGTDNVTVIVVRFHQKPEGLLDRLKIWNRNPD
jgi:serine/threonine protein phosphatase PrpC